jgi:tetratricopeptide (TPR) repeat protein
MTCIAPTVCNAMKIFISYSHKDDSLFQELVDGLTGVSFLIPPPSVWHDKLIPLASEWDEEIRAALHTADLVLLLVSRDFMKSQYIWEKEMTPALARHEAGQCKVLPIILRDTAAWEKSPFGKLQAAFRGKPVNGSANKRDKAWKEIIEGLIALAEQKAAAPVAVPPTTLHHLPIPRNPLFTGRDDDLQWIAKTLAGGRPAALLHGMGGVGKTQTAAEYAHRNADKYKVAWWVAAQTETEADAGYGALAEALNLPGYNPRNAEQTRQAVLAWMARESGWLVVLDNAENPQKLARWLPNTTKGHLLITSRNGNWTNFAKVHDLDVWSIPQAADFLLTRSGDNDRAAAEKLAAALGGLPLACETAAAYVAETGGSLARYDDLLAQQPVKLLDFLPQDTIYARSLPQVIHLATEAVERESPPAAEILRALAWLAPDNIPRCLLDEWPAEAMKVDAALAALLRRALLRKNGDGFSVHRLTQQIIRAADPAPNDGAAAAIRLLSKALIGHPQVDVQHWPRYAALLPHGAALFARLPAPPPELQAAGRIGNQLALFLDVAKGDYPAARLWYERALGLTEARVGPDHADLAIDLHNLGDLLRQMGDLAGAKPLFERALAISEKALGPEHPHVAYRLAGLGIVHDDLGELEEARRRHQRCREIWEGAHGPDHPLVAAALSNLACVLEKQGDQAGARRCFERALEINLNHKERGPDHPETGIYHSNLSKHLFKGGNAAAAETHLSCALAIREKYLDPDHPYTADTRERLAKVRAALGKGRRGG